MNPREQDAAVAIVVAATMELQRRQELDQAVKALERAKAVTRGALARAADLGIVTMLRAEELDGPWPEEDM